MNKGEHIVIQRWPGGQKRKRHLWIETARPICGMPVERGKTAEAGAPCKVCEQKALYLSRAPRTQFVRGVWPLPKDGQWRNKA